ncbi:MAG: hypothetical protein J6Y14_10925 [Fibrobacter sp.]|nr:hypothetical protein [Fibrobacter sp.]
MPREPAPAQQGTPVSPVYRPMMLNNFRVIFTDIPSAEMIRYAANSMLAPRISLKGPRT